MGVRVAVGVAIVIAVVGVGLFFGLQPSSLSTTPVAHPASHQTIVVLENVPNYGASRRGRRVLEARFGKGAVQQLSVAQGVARYGIDAPLADVTSKAMIQDNGGNAIVFGLADPVTHEAKARLAPRGTDVPLQGADAQ